MSQRLYMDYDWPCYEAGPSPYRQKASKMAQIQSYVNVLIENNRNYAEQLNVLKRENTDLRGQIELLMGEILRMKEKNEDILASTKAEYTQQVGKLIEELKDILNKKQQMEGSYKSLLEELSYQSESDKKSRGHQLQQVERNYQNKIKILNDRIAEQSRQIESNFYTQSDSKLRMVKEIDGLNYEVCELRKQNNDLRQAHRFDEEEIARLSGNIKLLNKEKEDLGVNLLKIQQEKNNQIIDLKQAMGQLREQLNDQIVNIKKLQTAILTKEKELQQMIDKYEITRKDKDQCEEYSLKLSTDLSDKSKDLANLKSEYSRLSDFSSKELKRMSELIKVLEADNNQLIKERDEFAEQEKVKQEQIYTLLDRIQSLDSELQDINGRLIGEKETNTILSKQGLELKEEIDSLLLEMKNEQEKCQLQAKHIFTLEQMIEKEKKKNYYLQGNNYDKEIAARQIPDELSKKYQKQMQDIYIRTDNEKTQLLQQFQYEKQRLVRMYEQALRQKEILFKDKIMALQSQIKELSLS